ncbi:GrpB family protein [Saccharibacillus sp. CPCC 101409]|uniref:GrpB family protein n=1 Tax=Saccharibacillus sp. CPCC 101409 TaxID=3058041 RepID=UPI0026731D25|nr:GrpB family protein [Saccharibacillus sp. CPCC 101409]MDO3411287.1 GrpB family protein [Saccharibacillus sp. CPCC 101409]
MQVRLSEYTPDWALRFEREAAFLRGVFGGEILRFEHFGSTSVPGMKAKPVIDMMAIVRDISAIDGYNDEMIALGYDAAGDWGIPGRRLFRKGGEERTHHIHFYEAGSPQIARHLALRDYLRARPDEAAAYSSFKEELAARFEETSGYSPAKKAFVSELEKRALAWENGRKRRGE